MTKWLRKIGHRLFYDPILNKEYYIIKDSSGRKRIVYVKSKDFKRGSYPVQVR